MQIRRLPECNEFTAGDFAIMRELLHPDRDYPFSGRYSLAYAKVLPGQCTRKHRLGSDEVYYILAGGGIMHVGEEAGDVSNGDVINIPPGEDQWIENNGDTELEFLCIVDPAWQEKDEDILS